MLHQNKANQIRLYPHSHAIRNLSPVEGRNEKTHHYRKNQGLKSARLQRHPERLHPTKRHEQV